MSIQDKIERIIKQIHVLFSEGPVISGEENKVIVDKTDIFPILEQLNLAIYELMDQYEATVQSRELAQRRSEKEGKELVERISQQTEDIYAASLIYTDDALNQVQKLMEDALAQSRGIWEQFIEDMEQEKRRVKEDQMELSDQLRDFKDSRKYQIIIEEHNRERERQEKEQTTAAEKKIKNEARHFPLNIKPEIKVNPAYFERHKQMFGKEVTMWPEETYTAESENFRDETAKEARSEAEDKSVSAAAAEVPDTLPGKSALKETAADILGAVLGKTSGSIGKGKDAKGTEGKTAELSAEEGSAKLPDTNAEEKSPLLQPVRVEDISPVLLPGEESLAALADSALEDEDLPLEDEDLLPMPETAASLEESRRSADLEEERKPFVMPEIKVDLNAEYFKWRKDNTGEGGEEEPPEEEPPKKKFLFGRKSGSK